LAGLLGLYFVRATLPQRPGEAVGVATERRAAVVHTLLPEQQNIPRSLALWEDCRRNRA